MDIEDSKDQQNYHSINMNPKDQDTRFSL